MQDVVRRIITLKRLVEAFDGLEQRFYKHCAIIEREIERMNLIQDNLNRNDFICEYEQIVFRATGFSVYVIELLNTAKCYFNGYKNEYDKYVTLDVENFKFKRRNFKKTYNLQIYKMFSQFEKYKANRNIMVHDCAIELNTFILDNKYKTFDIIISCNKILNGIYGKCNEFELQRSRKHREEVGRHEIRKFAEKVGIYISGAQ